MTKYTTLNQCFIKYTGKTSLRQKNDLKVLVLRELTLDLVNLDDFRIRFSNGTSHFYHFEQNKACSTGDLIKKTAKRTQSLNSKTF